MPLKLLDIIVTVLLPIIAGTSIYFFKNIIELPPSFITHYLADGLWAFSFINAILIVWNRHLSRGWLMMIVFIFIAFEVLQHFEVINGTGDIYDILTYFIFAFIAVITNRYFKKQFHHLNDPHAIS